MASMRERWSALAPREQRALLIGGIGVALILLIGGLLPLERNVGAAKARVEQQRSDLAWLGTLGPQLARVARSSGAGQGGGQSLVVLVDQLAREHAIGGQLTGTQPAGEGSVSVRFQQVPFDALAAWAAALVQRSGARIVTASVEGAGASGLVSATVVLRTP